MKVFIDTGAFVAFIFKRESFHGRVMTQYGIYKQNRSQLITSTYVLDELFTRCVYRAGEHGAKLALDLIDKAIANYELTVLDVDQTVFNRARTSFLKFAEHKISFTDATTYVLCKDLRLDEVFTLDGDFKKIGLSTSF